MRAAALAGIVLLFGSAATSFAQTNDPPTVRERLLRVATSAPSEQPERREALLSRFDDIDEDIATIVAADPPWGPTERLAAWMIGERGDDDLCGHLEARFGVLDDDLASQMAVASGVARCSDEREPLRALLDAEDPVIQVKAALLLGLHRDVASADRVAAMLDAAEFADYQVFVALATGLFAEADLRETLRPMLRVTELRDYAAIAIARHGDDTTALDLGFAMENSDATVRYYAVAAFIELHPSGGRAILAGALDDPDPRVAALAERGHRLWDRAP